MEERLVPVNAVVALLRDEPSWPCSLHEQGLRLHFLEVPVQTSRGVVRIDVMAYRVEPPVVLLVEQRVGGTLRSSSWTSTWPPMPTRLSDGAYCRLCSVDKRHR